MGGLLYPWLVGTGIVAWREVKSSSHMPVPAALMGVTGLFVVLSLVADMSPGARPVVTALGWGLDIAGLLNILPAGLFGQVQKAQATEAAAEKGSQATSSSGPVAV